MVSAKLRLLDKSLEAFERQWLSRPSITSVLVARVRLLAGEHITVSITNLIYNL